MKRKFLIKCAGRKLWKDDVIPRKPIDNQVNNLNNHKLLNDIITEPGPQLTNKKILFLETKPTLNLKQVFNMLSFFSFFFPFCRFGHMILK